MVFECEKSGAMAPGTAGRTLASFGGYRVERTSSGRDLHARVQRLSRRTLSPTSLPFAWEVVERADSGWFELFGVMKLVPHDFHDQTDQRIRNGICR